MLYDAYITLYKYQYNIFLFEKRLSEFSQKQILLVLSLKLHGTTTQLILVKSLSMIVYDCLSLLLLHLWPAGYSTVTIIYSCIFPIRFLGTPSHRIHTNYRVCRVCTGSVQCQQIASGHCTRMHRVHLTH